MRHKWGTAGTVGLLAVGAVLGVAGPAAAHPLGNFTVNRHDGIVVAVDEVRVRHVVDLAEIPTVQAWLDLDADGDGTPSAAELARYAQQECAAALPAVGVRLDGVPVRLGVARATARTASGEAGLPTLRLDCDLRGPAELGAGWRQLTFADRSDGADVGWREVTVAGDGVTVRASDVPASSPSAVLTDYPGDPQAVSTVSEASAQVRAGGPALLPAADPGAPGSGVGDVSDAGLLGDLADRAGSWVGVLLTLLVAVGVGAAHAVAPGHGKSVVAFALAGRRARAVPAALAVGATVTASHTASVLLLGVVVAGGTQVVPSSVYPVLGAVSGGVVLMLGLALVASARRRGAFPLRHTHPHDGGGHAHPRPHPHAADAHTHRHHGHSHAHGTDGVTPAHHRIGMGQAGQLPTAAATALLDIPLDATQPSSPPHPHPHSHPHHDDGAPRRGVLMTLGLTGGLVPSPTAVVVLLATVAAGRAWLGVLLVLAFGVGMAATLGAVGLLVLRGQERLLRRLDGASHPAVAAGLARLPLLTALAVCAVGILLVVRSLT